MPEENIAAVGEPASATAQRQLLRRLADLPPQFPPELLRIGDFVQRNAAEDMLLVRDQKLPRAEFSRAVSGDLANVGFGVGI